MAGSALRNSCARPLRYLGIRHTVKRVTLEEPDDILFTEITEPEGVAGLGHDEASAAKLT